MLTSLVQPAAASPSPCSVSSSPLLLQNFGEHGRELISSEIGLHVLRLLCDATQRAPLLRKFKLEPSAVDELLQRTVFKASEPPRSTRGCSGGTAWRHHAFSGRCREHARPLTRLFRFFCVSHCSAGHPHGEHQGP